MATKGIKTEPEGVESVHQICRLCMSQESLDDVFTEEGVCQWISDYLSITISAEDNMSHSICAICRIRLAEFHQFRVRSQEVQAMLQSTIRSTNTTEEMKLVRGSVELEQLSHQISQNLDEQLEDHTNKEFEEPREFDKKKHKAAKLKLKLYRERDSTIVTYEYAAEKMRNESEDSDEEFSMEQNESYTSMLNEKEESDQSNVIEDIIDIEEMKIERVHDKPSEDEQSVDTEDMNSITTQKADFNSSSLTTDIAVPIEMAGTAQVQCSICLKEFPNKVKLRAHTYHHRKNILCPICEKPFSNRGQMEKHMLTHLSITDRERLDKPFKCEICENSFRRKCNLKAHLTEVHGPKNYPCHICGFKVTRRSNLRSHLLIHSLRGDSEQDFQSLQREPKDEIDGKDTSSDPSNDSALREKKMKCGECQETFQTDKGLYRHYKLVHRKAFKCSLCNAAFGVNKLLEKHIDSVHKPKKARQPKEQRFKCYKCDLKYTRRYSMMTHLRKHHGVSTEDYQTEQMLANPEENVNEKETNSKSSEDSTHCNRN